MKNLMICLIVFFLISVSTGCSIRPTIHQPSIHDLGLAVQQAGQHQVAWKISSVDAPVWLWDDRIRYRLLYADPTQVRFYAQDRWIAPPPALLEQRLAPLAKAQDYVLQINLLNFEQQFTVPEQAKVILSFHVTAHSSKNSEAANERYFLLQMPTSTANAAGAVDGFTKLTAQASDEIQQWLAGLAGKKRKQPN
jgi:cholesterol transport system auxiliary component